VYVIAFHKFSSRHERTSSKAGLNTALTIFGDCSVDLKENALQTFFPSLNDFASSRENSTKADRPIDSICVIPLGYMKNYMVIQIQILRH